MNALNPDHHRIAAGLEVATLCYLSQRPPLRIIRQLSPMQRAIAMGVLWYGYTTYLNTQPSSRPVNEADLLGPIEQ